MAVSFMHQKALPMLLLSLVWCLLFAPITAFMAGQRGYDVMPWYLAGMALGPLGLLARLLPRRKHAPEMLFAPEYRVHDIG
jgi:hypothetical protein